MKANFPDLPHVGIYITHEEVTGEKANVADAIHLLSQFNIDGVLRMIALINNTLLESYPLPMQRYFQELLVKLLLPPHIKNSLVNSPFYDNASAFLFYRQQQLVMLRLALLSCPSKNGLPWNEQAQHAFGEACLMVSDFIGLGEGEFGNPEDTFQSASNVLPLTTLSMDTEMEALVGRAYDMWLRIPNEPSVKAEADCVPVSARFESKYGVSLEVFIDGLFVLLAKCERFDPSASDSLSTVIVDVSKHVANSRFSQQSFETILRIISQNLSQMRNRAFAEPVQSARNDFSVLQRYPYIEVQPNVFVCFDRTFLRKMFTDGIYLLIHEALQPEEAKKFQSFFGKIFAAYVDSVFAHISSQSPAASDDIIKTRLAFTGSREKKGEVCDVLLKSGGAWVVMECKGSLLTPRAKYSGNAGALESDLRAKFLGKLGEKKGVRQLANSINKLGESVPINAPELDWAECKLIYPCIVSYDSAVTSTFLPEIFQREFSQSLVPLQQPPAIRPLTVLSVADLELFSSLKGQPKLSSMIATYHHSRLPAESFDNFLRRTQHNNIKVEGASFYKSFERVLESAKHYFD